MKAKSLLLFALTFSIFSKGYCFEQEAFEFARRGGKGLNLSERDLIRANTEDHNLIEADLLEAILTKTKLQYSWLNGANLIKAKAYKANFFRSNLAYAKLMKADLKNAILNQAILQGTNFSEADLTDADFSNIDIENSWERFVQLLRKIKYKLGYVSKPKNYSQYPNRINTNFEKVTANNTNFQNLILINANFKNSDLTKAKFNNSVLAYADFSDIKSFNGTDFRGTVLYGAKFNGANLNDIIVEGVIFEGVKGLTPDQKEYLKEQGAIFYSSVQKLKQKNIVDFFKPITKAKEKKLVLDEN